MLFLHASYSGGTNFNQLMDYSKCLQQMAMSSDSYEILRKLKKVSLVTKCQIKTSKKTFYILALCFVF